MLEHFSTNNCVSEIVVACRVSKILLNEVIKNLTHIYKTPVSAYVLNVIPTYLVTVIAVGQEDYVK